MYTAVLFKEGRGSSLLSLHQSLLRPLRVFRVFFSVFHVEVKMDARSVRLLFRPQKKNRFSLSKLLSLTYASVLPAACPDWL